jgi:uncharacterized protein (DUF488 family)
MGICLVTVTCNVVTILAPAALTVGHGTLAAGDLVGLLAGAGVRRLVDVRAAPGSRRHPHFGRVEMSEWVPAAGVAYRWEPDLGGWRKPTPDSANVVLRHPAFRGYADHMATPAFAAALDRLLEEAATGPTAAMCSESLWWRCHRRLLADAAVLLHGAEVVHLLHDDRLDAHRVTEGARVADATLVYDGGQLAL